MTIVTGLPRSGSTLVYNVCRILQEHHSERPVWAGWINDFKYRFLQKRWVYVLKIHQYDPLIASLPCRFIHTKRDMLEIAASLTEKEKLPTIEEIKGYIEDDKKWTEHSHLVLSYSIMDDRAHLIEQIAEFYGIKNFSCSKVLEQLDTLVKPTTGNQEYDPVTLMHPNHISGAGKDWQNILPQHYINEIISLQDV